MAKEQMSGWSMVWRLWVHRSSWSKEIVGMPIVLHTSLAAGQVMKRWSRSSAMLLQRGQELSSMMVLCASKARVLSMFLDNSHPKTWILCGKRERQKCMAESSMRYAWSSRYAFPEEKHARSIVVCTSAPSVIWKSYNKTQWERERERRARWSLSGLV
jgi:hypothetical protein